MNTNKITIIGSIIAIFLIIGTNDSFVYTWYIGSTYNRLLSNGITIIFLALLLIIKHIPNIIRIIKGTESKVIKNKKIIGHFKNSIFYLLF